MSDERRRPRRPAGAGAPIGAEALARIRQRLGALSAAFGTRQGPPGVAVEQDGSGWHASVDIGSGPGLVRVAIDDRRLAAEVDGHRRVAERPGPRHLGDASLEIGIEAGRLTVRLARAAAGSRQGEGG